MKYTTLPVFLLCCLFGQRTICQTDTLLLSLSEVIALAQSDAPDALIAETRMKSEYWRYRSVQADFKPFVNFFGDSQVNRDIDAITQPDGSLKFQPRSQMRNGVGLSVNQIIPATGGRVYLRNRLQRLDIFLEDQNDIVSYFATPISIGYEQEIFGMNQFKWNRKLAPLEYEEASRAFAEEMENVAFEAAIRYFQVLTAQSDLAAAIRDKANADTLFNISQGRFDVGRIAETELLQIELSAMNADAAVQRARLNLQSGNEQLRNFLGVQNATFFKLEEPGDVPEYELDANRALQFAKANRSQSVSFERRLMEAEMNYAQAKANRGFQMNVYAEFGLSQTGETISEAFSSPLDNEVAGLGFSIPIADWGKAKARLETACANRELTRVTVAQDRVDFEQDIILKVNRFTLQREQVALSQRAYEVSQKRMEMTRNRYYIGKIGITDLNIAIAEKEFARQSFMASLQELWLAHYDLRRSTLYDFAQGKELVKNLEGVEEGCR